RHKDATKVEGEGGAWEAFENQLVGPQVAPGTYTARLTVDGTTLETAFEIRKDPRVTASQTDLEAQFALASKVHAKLSETHATINGIRKLKKQLDLWEARAKEQGGEPKLLAAATALRRKARAVEGQGARGEAEGVPDA